MPSILARLIRIHLRSKLRGRTRLTFALARRFPSLQAVPIEVMGRPSVYVDLRDGYAHELLRDSPLPQGWWEPESQAALTQLVQPGDTAWDVGANLGLYVSLLGSLVGPTGRVVVFEPNPDLLPALARTVSAIPGATLLPVGLADRDGEATFHVPDDHTMSGLTPWAVERIGGTASRRTITIRRMDTLVQTGEIPRPDIIKIDIEGAEPLAFAGGTEVLNRADAPIVLFEANIYSSPSYGFTSAEGARRLLAFERAQYTCYGYDETEQAWLPFPLDGSFSGNALAIPAARRHRWSVSA